MVLPHGIEHEVNNMDYDRTKTMCDDFMKHPRAIQACLEKAELVALRLYSGPMSDCPKRPCVSVTALHCQ